MESVKYIGLDVHQSTISVAVLNRRVARLSGFSLPVPEQWVPRPCVLCLVPIHPLHFVPRHPLQFWVWWRLGKPALDNCRALVS